MPANEMKRGQAEFSATQRAMIDVYGAMAER